MRKEKPLTKTEGVLLTHLKKMGEYGVEVTSESRREYRAAWKLIRAGRVRLDRQRSGWTYIRKGAGSYTYYKRIDYSIILIRMA